MQSKFELRATSKSLQAEIDRLITSQSIMDQYVAKATENKSELDSQLNHLNNLLNQVSNVEADCISSLLSDVSTPTQYGNIQEAEVAAFVDQSILSLKENTLQPNRNFIAKCDFDILKFNEMTDNLKTRMNFLLKKSDQLQSTTTKLRSQVKEEDTHIHIFTEKLTRRLRASNYHKQLLASALTRDKELLDEKIALSEDNRRLQKLIDAYKLQNASKSQNHQLIQTIPPQNHRDSQTNWLEVDNILNM